MSVLLALNWPGKSWIGGQRSSSTGVWDKPTDWRTHSFFQVPQVGDLWITFFYTARAQRKRTFHLQLARLPILLIIHQPDLTSHELTKKNIVTTHTVRAIVRERKKNQYKQNPFWGNSIVVIVGSNFQRKIKKTPNLIQLWV